MAMFGWIVMFAFMAVVTVPVSVIAALSMSRTTIGGAQQSTADRVFAVVAVILLVLGWWGVASLAPFNISMK